MNLQIITKEFQFSSRLVITNPDKGFKCSLGKEQLLSNICYRTQIKQATYSLSAHNIYSHWNVLHK